jgi:hypothetical protein
MWINQPSTLQPYHKYHGMNVLVDMNDTAKNHAGETCVWVYFTQGDTVSVSIAKVALSHGWTK